MKNISDTEAYTLFDHVFSKTIRSLSHVVGLKKITQPFWNRWLASGVDEAIIFRFLDSVGTIDGWADTAKSVVREELAAFEKRRVRLTRDQEIRALRDLSYICNMAQWGCLPLNDDRRALYAKCRDYYIEAETLAYPENYQRIEIRPAAKGAISVQADTAQFIARTRTLRLRGVQINEGGRMTHQFITGDVLLEGAKAGKIEWRDGEQMHSILLIGPPSGPTNGAPSNPQ